jgi:DNA-binding CsgD family transcriptional regulator
MRPYTPLSAAVPLAAYILWLLSFPMQGFVLKGLPAHGALPYFLLPTVCCFLLLALFRQIPRWKDLSIAGVLGTSAATVLAALIPEWTVFWLILAGGCSPLVLLRACFTLRHSPGGVLGAGVALVAANGALALLQSIPAAPAVMLLVLGWLPLLALRGEHRPWEGHLDRSLFRILPFLLVFYLLGGLLYAAVMPRYMVVAPYPGVELLFYMAAVLGAVRLFRKYPDLSLALGIICGMVSVSFLSGSSSVFVHLGAFAIQTGFGFVDLFVLGLMISGTGGGRTGALTAGVMCLGILLGESLIRFSGSGLELFTLWGNLAMTLAVLLLYIRGRVRKAGPYRFPSAPSEPEPILPPELPSWLLARLSIQERTTLELVLAGKRFKDVAREMEVSLSSVKTYMRRIYEKLDVNGKEEMLLKLSKEGRSGQESGEVPEARRTD